MRHMLLAVLGIFIGSGVVWGQTSSPPSDQAQLVQTLLGRIDQLEKRVNDLEGKLACSTPPCESKSQLVAAREVVEPPATTVAVVRSRVKPTTSAAVA